MSEFDWGALEKAGETAWTVFKDGAPTAEAHSSHFSAGPKGVGFDHLTDARRKSFTVTGMWTTHYFGRVVEWEAVVDIDYGAKYKGGGAYLPSIMVVPTEVHAWWGFHVELDVAFGEPVNIGHEHKKPIASVEMTLTEKKWCLTESHEYATRYEIYGDGRIKNLTTGADIS